MKKSLWQVGKDTVAQWIEDQPFPLAARFLITRFSPSLRS
jgi:hypothetical protein